ncbi:laminin subunit beta-1-like isoform X2 [Tachypleus tridentatus]|uniref:laminin subunit beta-1-like isoform X2 n=1 Tax=Tachypleus tridentatus TaxID=6853 RepID=UPI003FCF0E3E
MAVGSMQLRYFLVGCAVLAALIPETPATTAVGDAKDVLSGTPPVYQYSYFDRLKHATSTKSPFHWSHSNTRTRHGRSKKVSVSGLFRRTDSSGSSNIDQLLPDAISKGFTDGHTHGKTHVNRYVFHNRNVSSEKDLSENSRKEYRKEEKTSSVYHRSGSSFGISRNNTDYERFNGSSRVSRIYHKHSFGGRIMGLDSSSSSRISSHSTHSSIGPSRFPNTSSVSRNSDFHSVKYDERRRDESHENLHPFDYQLLVTTRGTLSPHACDESSCYPATGNLLIGRVDQLKATSTCGLEHIERYCIVSHLKEKKKCFYCDSRPERRNNPRLYHGIENVVSRIGRKLTEWWQAENGVQNVTIQLDLEAEFHFTHIIMTFKTFRPAAMLIERSDDFGRTWNVYQYFAYNCHEAFPGVPTQPRWRITDVICDSYYSRVEPSTGGEVIFRVLPPHIHVDDPYSPAVQNLLKMTNLRINFTQVHTLGDNLLDPREEIKEKYYYAIYDMVVRGSCSCYGHASRCIAEDGQMSRPDMVYGKCECTHNTKGRNCEQCENFYNDLPWRPAVGLDTNACKKCNCNNHATKCHFDPAVWEVTGRVSGGVCDYCEHNTIGRNCEQCKPFFYQDPNLDITNPSICQPCDCDPRGSIDGGTCDAHTDLAVGSKAGSCHCKPNVGGVRCDRCKDGYWKFLSDNPDGCEPCSCNTFGTIGSRGCNVFTGECTCKRNVVGRDCNQCLPEHWGLSSFEDGCKPCECDLGGSYDNNCDVVTGHCHCRPHIDGRTCDRPKSGYFVGNLDYMIYEAEFDKDCSHCQVVVHGQSGDRETTWTGLGFMRAYEGSELVFDVTDVPESLEYDIVIRYEPQLPGKWEEAKVVIKRPGPVDPTGPCANTIPQDDIKTGTLLSEDRFVVLRPTACLEKGLNYKMHIEFKHYKKETDIPTATILVDSIALIPRIDNIPFFKGSQVGESRHQEFEHFYCRQAFFKVVRPVLTDICKKYLFSIGSYVFGGGRECSCNPSGSLSSICEQLGGQCKCKKHVMGRRCDCCAPESYGFGPAGCRACDCHSIGSLDNFCDPETGQCKCQPNTYGQKCDECQPGYWNYPNCQQCDCNGHADTCDPRTGFCVDCRDFTAGPKCDKCETGFYGDPRIGIEISCQPCPCSVKPGNEVSHVHGCYLDPRTQNVVCDCSLGYAGERCDRCANNYFGNPNAPGGECRKCECNNNIDETMPGNCDTRTGKCQHCMFNTEGFHCEHCKPGFYGMTTRQQCIECICNRLGTNHSAGTCDKVTGQCHCFPNVVGQSCDECAPNHWNLGSGHGCEECNCDPLGSYDSQCNEFDGQCHCRVGRGGRRCNECESNHWGDPSIQCYRCECSTEGSATPQCYQNNGTCICLDGIAGDRCDQCGRGHTGRAPYCSLCGDCFGNWSLIIQELKDETIRLVAQAKDIQDTGTMGAYTDKFVAIEKELEEVREILNNPNITERDIDEVQELADRLRKILAEKEAELQDIEVNLGNTTNRIIAANLVLTDLQHGAEDLVTDAQNVKNNASALQEANVEGAFNITKAAQQKSRAADGQVRNTTPILYESERQRHYTENLIEQAQNHYNKSYEENEVTMNDIGDQLKRLEGGITDINNMVCDGSGTVYKCDSLCGGAGCDKCGGISCGEGAVTKAHNALDLAKEAEKILNQKEDASKDLLEKVKDAKENADRVLEEAKLAFAQAQAAKNKSQNATRDIEELLDRIENFLVAQGSRPAEIRVLAEECLGLKISLQPDQITKLAQQINDTIKSLTDIDAILSATKGGLSLARGLKERADEAKVNADGILGNAQLVKQLLDEAKEAQDRAKAAIDIVKGDIGAAEVDLAQIESETATAQEITSKTMDDVEALKDKLDDLKKKFVQNGIDAQKATRETSIADRLAKKAEEDAEELEDKYNKADKNLIEKAKKSGTAKERAKQLKERANKLAEEANSKLKELQAMDDEFEKNEYKLTDFSKILDELNQQMMDHLTTIDERSAFYRDCQL